MMLLIQFILSNAKQGIYIYRWKINTPTRWNNANENVYHQQRGTILSKWRKKNCKSSLILEHSALYFHTLPVTTINYHETTTDPAVQERFIENENRGCSIFSILHFDARLLPYTKILCLYRGWDIIAYRLELNKKNIRPNEKYFLSLISVFPFKENINTDEYPIFSRII